MSMEVAEVMTMTSRAVCLGSKSTSMHLHISPTSKSIYIQLFYILNVGVNFEISCFDSCDLADGAKLYKGICLSSVHSFVHCCVSLLKK